jgi:hypothetical protein
MAEGPKSISKHLPILGRRELALATDDDEEYEDEEDLRNDEWFKENYLDLMEDHPREWIAVSGQRLVCTGATRIEAEDRARELLGEKSAYSVYFVAPVDTITDVGYARRS